MFKKNYFPGFYRDELQKENDRAKRFWTVQSEDLIMWPKLIWLLYLKSNFFIPSYHYCSYSQ